MEDAEVGQYWQMEQLVQMVLLILPDDLLATVLAVMDEPVLQEHILSRKIHMGTK